MAISDSCRRSSGKKIAGKDCESQKFISRLVNIDLMFCDIVRRTRIEEARMIRRCEDYDEMSSESSSSSSSEEPSCCLECPDVIPELMYLISVNDLNQDAYDALALLEEEACATLRKLILFEKNSKNCEALYPPSSSSSSESSSDSSSESSSEGSSSEDLECLTTVYIAQYCPGNEYLNLQLFDSFPNVGMGECFFAAEDIGFPSSSEAWVEPALYLCFNLATSQWRLIESGIIIATMDGGTEHEPRGTYMMVGGMCDGYTLFIVG